MVNFHARPDMGRLQLFPVGNRTTPPDGATLYPRGNQAAFSARTPSGISLMAIAENPMRTALSAGRRENQYWRVP